MNPLTAGPTRRSTLKPTRPWLYGTVECPEGYYCRICWWAMEYGGYDLEYATLDDLVNAMKTNGQLAAEFANSVTQTIELVNSGKIKHKLRGQKRKHE